MQRTFSGYIFDLDGTIYLGDDLLPGAKTAIGLLRSDKRKVLFLTNKPLDRSATYAEKLTRLGIPTAERDVVNSAQVSARYLARTMSGARVFVLGEEVLIQELLRAGLVLATDPRATDVVLISLDRTLSYQKLHFAYHAAKNGARMIATNPDLVCPMPNDEIIDAGATIAALEALLKRPVDTIIGKPSPIMIETVLRHLGLRPEECLMVGDRLETDIAMGQAAGMATALVLTGVTRRCQIGTSAAKPDYVLENVGEVVNITYRG